LRAGSSWIGVICLNPSAQSSRYRFWASRVSSRYQGFRGAAAGGGGAAVCVSAEPVGAPSVFVGCVVATPGCVAGAVAGERAAAAAPAGFFGPSMWASTRSRLRFSSFDSRLDSDAK